MSHRRRRPNVLRSERLESRYALAIVSAADQIVDSLSTIDMDTTVASQVLSVPNPTSLAIAGLGGPFVDGLLRGDGSPVTVSVLQGGTISAAAGIQVFGRLVMATGGSTAENTTVRVSPGGALLGDGLIAGTAVIGNGALGTVLAPAVLAPRNVAGLQRMGVMTVGSLEMGPSGQLIIDIAGTVAGQQHDQIVATDKINLGSARLHVRSSMPVTSAAEFTVIRNQGTAAVEGMFTDDKGNPLAEGGLVAADFGPGVDARISYKGGDGNDVVIRALPPARPIGVITKAAAGVHRAGEILIIKVPMTEVIHVEGVLRLRLNTIPVRHAISYDCGCPSTISFTYTVQPGDEAAELDYAGVDAIEPGNATVRDVRGRSASLLLPLPGTAASLSGTSDVTIDAARPTVTSVNFASPAGTYGPGDTIAMVIRFTEAVTVTGSPVLQLAVGSSAKKVAIFDGGSGTSELRFTYTVAQGDAAEPLDYLDIRSLQLEGASILDRIGNEIIPTLPLPGLLGSLSRHRRLTIAAGPGVSLPQPLKILGGGAVDGCMPDSLLALYPGLNPLTHCSTTAAGPNAQPSKTIGLIQYDVPVGQTLDSAGGVDVGGVLGVPAGSSTSARTPVRVLPKGRLRGDGVVAGSLTVGSSSYSDSVATLTPGTLATNNPIGSMTIGTLSLNAGARFIADISGNLPGVGHDQLVVTNSVTLNNPRLILRRSSFVPAPNTNFMVVRNDGADAVTGVFVDSNGRTLPEGTVLTDSFGPGLVPRISYRGGDGNDVVIRVTTPPKVLGLTTTTPDGVLRVGDAITIQVLMSKRVVVEGTPRLRLNVADMRFATYTGGTGTTTLSFSYTIQPGDAAAKLDAFNNLPVRLNGSRIADASGNAAQLTFVAPGMPGTLSASKTILVDGVAPVILGIGSKTGSRSKSLDSSQSEVGLATSVQTG
jgi:hypothetical protein